MLGLLSTVALKVRQGRVQATEFHVEIIRQEVVAFLAIMI